MPTTPVAYPARFIIFGRVSRSAGMHSGELPLRMLAPGLCRQAYWPVSRPYRVGVHMAEGLWASVKRIPPAASLSRCGVLTWVAP